MSITDKQIAQGHIYRQILEIPGVVVELGVGIGQTFTTWMAYGHNYEPHNWTRRYVGFDTFAGFPAVSPEDHPETKVGDQNHGEPSKALSFYLEHFGRLLTKEPTNPDGTYPRWGERIELVTGDIVETVPRYCAEHPATAVALLFVDTDIYEPSKVGLEYFWPRIPSGGIVLFDEAFCEFWRGETTALREVLGRELPYRRVHSYPQWAYVVKP